MVWPAGGPVSFLKVFIRHLLPRHGGLSITSKFIMLWQNQNHFSVSGPDLQSR